MEIAQTGEAVPASSFALSAGRAERWLGRMVEMPVALLTALEVLILLAGVISRYVFHRPFTWSDALASILFLWLAMLIAAIGAGLWVLKPMFVAMGNYKLVVFFVLLVAAGVLAGAPIAFVFAIATFAFLAITTRTPLTVVVSRMDEGMSHIILLSVPLFVFLGLLIEATGMARAMVDFLASLLGHVRGGLSYVLLGAMYLVSGISGSKAADMAAVAPVLFPEMKRRGAKPGELVALLSSSGAMS